MPFTPYVKLIDFLADPLRGALCVLGTSLGSAAITGLLSAQVADSDNTSGAVFKSVGGSAGGAAAGSLIYYFFLRKDGWVTSAKWRRIVYALWFASPVASITGQVVALLMSLTGDGRVQIGAGTGMGFLAWIAAFFVFNKYIEPLVLTDGTTSMEGLVYKGMSERLRGVATAFSDKTVAAKVAAKTVAAAFSEQ